VGSNPTLSATKLTARLAFRVYRSRNLHHIPISACVFARLPCIFPMSTELGYLD
jgi:hypothetical protein